MMASAEDKEFIKVLQKCDFSEDSWQHKAQLKNLLAQRASEHERALDEEQSIFQEQAPHHKGTVVALNLSQDELLETVAAYETSTRQIVAPYAHCDKGLRAGACRRDGTLAQCEHLIFEKGIWYCTYQAT